MTPQANALLALALALSAAARAEDLATIRGDAHDPKGKPIPGATVLLVPAGDGPVTTAPDGSFVVTGLRPGPYDVVILESGFNAWAAREVQVDAGATATLHAVLEVEKTPPVVDYDEPTQRELAAYADVLAATDEPPLCSPARVRSGLEAYRFVWLRTFHHPVVVELRFNSPSDVAAVYKETDGAGGYEMGKLLRTTVRSVAKDLQDELNDGEMAEGALAELREEGFEELWNLPFRVEVLDRKIGLDGATWTIEGVKDSRCHVVTRWSPGANDPVRGIGLRLLEYTKERPYYDEVY